MSNWPKSKKKIKQNNTLLEQQLQRELREENSLFKLKNFLRRKYPLMTEEKLKKRFFQHMQAQLEQIFEIDTAFISSSKMSNKTMEELEKDFNQDSDEEPILEEKSKSYWRHYFRNYWRLYSPNNGGYKKEESIRNSSIKSLERLRLHRIKLA